MKRTSLAFLIALLMVLVHSLPIVAQEQVSALETYAKWRRVVLGRHPGGISTPHYSVATVTKHLPDGKAQIEFAVVGQMSSYTLEIQPIKIKESSDGQTSREVTGEMSKVRQNIPPRLISPSYISEPVAIISVGSAANAIEVKWTTFGATKEISTTLLLPLEDVPVASVFGVIVTPPEVAATIYKKTTFASTSMP